ncbi:Lrp/AsnC family transcriptional regulator [bacterium]|nr:MAG: Lrp/AsnC family transcriptional regulator [bacterium]
MVTALVHIKTERTKVNAVGETLSELAGVTEVYMVAGKVDLIALLRTKDNEAMAELVTRGILEVDGIIGSETMVAFRSFSKFDLAELFDVGSESARN